MKKEDESVFKFVCSRGGVSAKDVMKRFKWGHMKSASVLNKLRSFRLLGKFRRGQTNYFYPNEVIVLRPKEGNHGTGIELRDNFVEYLVGNR